MTLAQRQAGPGEGVLRYTQPWLDRIAARAASGGDALAERRTHAADRFARNGFPTVRHEDWRFTNVAPIARTEYAEAQSGDVPKGEVASRFYEGCLNLVFVDGLFREDLSDPLPGGGTARGDLTIEPLSAALERGAPPELGGYADVEHNAFVALNTALFEDGAMIRAARGRVIERPVHLLYLSRATEMPGFSFPRTLVVAEENSQITVLESFVGLSGPGSYLSCPVTEIVGHDASVIDHYKVQKESLDGQHMAGQYIWLGKQANFSSHSIQWGGGLVRTDVNAVLDGEGTSCTLNGIYVLAGKQHVDNNMRVEHAKPNCYSHELYKGILEERARAVFTGRIYVHPGAQKTDAFQDNRNLLLSKNALVNSNPQLEIFADDVRCSHGSATGHLDEDALFYLRSRGIDEKAATSLLTYAFASEFIEKVKSEVLRSDLEEFLFSRLPGGEIVRQAT